MTIVRTAISGTPCEIRLLEPDLVVEIDGNQITISRTKNPEPEKVVVIRDPRKKDGWYGR